MIHIFLLHTDHFQFYLEDLSIAHDTSGLWLTPLVDHRLDILDGLLAIGIGRWGLNTTITIELDEQLPTEADIDAWDCVLEASIRTVSGQLSLTTPEGHPETAPTFPIMPGWYRTRIYYGQLEDITDELAENGPDLYRLIIWQQTPREPQILKSP